MRAFALAAILFILPAAEVAPERPGRIGAIDLIDGTSHHCTIYSYDAAKQEFTVREAETDRTLPIGQVKKITFGEAAGDYIVEQPEQPERSPGQAVPFAEISPAFKQRWTEEFYSTPRRQQAMGLLWALTDHFRNKEAIQRFEADLPAHIKIAHEGKLADQEKNQRQALVVVKALLQQPDQAKQALDALKADFPGDFPALLTPQGIVNRIQEEANRMIRRPFRDRPRPGDSRSPDSRPADEARPPG